MSLELLVLYSEMAEARIRERTEVAFDDMVAAVRIGNADDKSFKRWLARRRAQASRGAALTGESLERAILGVQAMFPGHVIRETRAG